jgi:hypothetical protein
MTTDAERVDWLLDMAFPSEEKTAVFQAKSERLIVQGVVLGKTGREGLDAAMAMTQEEVEIYMQAYRDQCPCPKCTTKRLLATMTAEADVN